MFVCAPGGEWVSLVHILFREYGYALSQFWGGGCPGGGYVQGRGWVCSRGRIPTSPPLDMEPEGVGFPPLLTPNGCRHTYGWQAVNTHPTGMLFLFITIRFTARFTQTGNTKFCIKISAKTFNVNSHWFN